MTREKLEAIIRAVSELVNTADGDLEWLETAHAELGLYIARLHLIPTEIHTRIIRRSA